MNVLGNLLNLDEGEKVSLATSRRHTYLVVTIADIAIRAKAERIVEHFRATGHVPPLGVQRQEAGKFTVQAFVPLTKAFVDERRE